MNNDATPPEDVVKNPAEKAPPIIKVQQLFQGQREIWIEHDGTRYRLRITRRNKLILQK